MISKASHITKTILGLAVCAVALGSAGNALAGGGTRPAGLQLQSQPTLMRFSGSRAAGLQFQSQPKLMRFSGSRAAGLQFQSTHHRIVGRGAGPWPER